MRAWKPKAAIFDHYVLVGVKPDFSKICGTFNRRILKITTTSRSGKKFNCWIITRCEVITFEIDSEVFFCLARETLSYCLLCTKGNLRVLAQTFWSYFFHVGNHIGNMHAKFPRRPVLLGPSLRQLSTTRSKSIFNALIVGYIHGNIKFLTSLKSNGEIESSYK